MLYDALFLVGFAMLSYGLYLVDIVFFLVIAGLILMLFSLAATRAKMHRKAGGTRKG